MQLSQIQIIPDVSDYDIVSPVYLNAVGNYDGVEGEIYLRGFEIDREIESEGESIDIDYYVYDQNGERDEFGDPSTFKTGRAATYYDPSFDSHFIAIEDYITLIADPQDGSMDATVQIQYANQVGAPLITTISIPVRSDQELSGNQQSTQVTHEKTIHDKGPPPSIDYGSFTVEPTPPSIVEEEDEPSFEEEQPVESTATSEDEYLGVDPSNEVLDSILDNSKDLDIKIATTKPPEPTPPSIVEEKDEPSYEEEEKTVESPSIIEEIREAGDLTAARVSNQEDLIRALEFYSQIEIVDSFQLTQTVIVPDNTVITGYRNPIISTNTTAFWVQGSNVTLQGFTIQKLFGQETGRGVLVNLPSSSTNEPPSNITINAITFLGVGTSGRDKFGAIAVLGYNQNGLATIKNVKITNNVIDATPNTAIDVWEIEDLEITNNVVTNTQSGGGDNFGNGIRGDNISNTTISDNTFTNTGRMGIEVLGGGAGGVPDGARVSDLYILNNVIEQFAVSDTQGFRAGISISQGVDGAIVDGNFVNGANNTWNAGLEIAQNSKNIRFSNNTVRDVRDGVLTSAHCDTLFIIDNEFVEIKRYGIRIFQSWNVTITNNNILQSEAWRDTFYSNSEAFRERNGIGGGIYIQQCNGVKVLNNTIEGVYEQKYGSAAILVQSNYPTLEYANKLYYPSSSSGIELQREMVKYGLGVESYWNTFYGEPNVLVNTKPIQNIAGGNTLISQASPESTNKLIPYDESVLFSKNAAAVTLLNGTAGTKTTTSTETEGLSKETDTEDDPRISERLRSKEEPDKTYTLTVVNEGDLDLTIVGEGGFKPLPSKGVFSITQNVNQFTFVLTRLDDVEAVRLENARVDIIGTRGNLVGGNLDNIVVDAVISKGFTEGTVYVYLDVVDDYKSGDTTTDDDTTTDTGIKTDDTTTDTGIKTDDTTDDSTGGPITTDGGCCPGDPVTTCDPPVTYDPPVTFDPPPTYIPPPPPPPIIPFTPANCGKRPVVRIGCPKEEDPDNPDPEIIEEPPEEEILLFPAPVLGLQPPFLSNVNFDTNVTLAVPPPLDLEEDEDELETLDPIQSTASEKINICKDEECNTLGF